MGGKDRPQAVPEGSDRGRLLEEQQVRGAAAVRRAEPEQGHGRPREIAENLRPDVLSGHRIVGVPYGVEDQLAEEIIDVPVPDVRPASVTPNPGPHASGTAGASDVHIEPGEDRAEAEPADFQPARPRGTEDQGVGAGARLQDAPGVTCQGTAHVRSRSPPS